MQRSALSFTNDQLAVNAYITGGLHDPQSPNTTISCEWEGWHYSNFWPRFMLNLCIFVIFLNAGFVLRI